MLMANMNYNFFFFFKLVILTLNPSVCISIASMEQSVFNGEYFFFQQNEK